MKKLCCFFCCLILCPAAFNPPRPPFSPTQDEVHMSWAEGFLVVYDITSPQTLGHLEKLKKQIESTKKHPSSGTYAMVVVGNKIDLEHCRSVEQEYASQIASRIGASSHVMCSACGSESTIRFVFDELCREVARLRRQRSSPPPPPPFQKPERRRRSLAQVRQGLKMLVYTGKKHPSSQNRTPVGCGQVPCKGGSSPGNGGGGGGGGVRQFNFRNGKQPRGSNAMIMSAPVINNSASADDNNIFLSLFNESDYKKAKDEFDQQQVM